MTCVTQANTLDLAKEYLIDDARAYGFEPGVILSFTKITKEEYEAACQWGTFQCVTIHFRLVPSAFGLLAIA